MHPSGSRDLSHGIGKPLGFWTLLGFGPFVRKSSPLGAAGWSRPGNMRDEPKPQLFARNDSICQMECNTIDIRTNQHMIVVMLTAVPRACLGAATYLVIGGQRGITLEYERYV